jgi:membrane protease YdiL (CAAX protease family)
LAGSLILGTLHAFWHFPVYFVPGLILPGAFDLTAFLANTLAIIVMTIVWTWIFNNTRGSIWMAMLTHGASNANSMTFASLMALPGLAALPDDPWVTFKFFGVCALLIIIATRGRLSYKREDAVAITQKVSVSKAETT